VWLWNQRFTQQLTEPAFAAREALARRDARALARELLAMTLEEFSREFSKSPMKRAKLRA
jgi:epoxyqueuosine reductase QueG